MGEEAGKVLARIASPVSGWLLVGPARAVAEVVVTEGRTRRVLPLTARQLTAMRADLARAFTADADGSASQLMVAGIEFARREAEALAETLDWLATERAAMLQETGQ